MAMDFEANHAFAEALRPECRKCGRKMIGPHWDAVSDTIQYICTCGWQTTQAPIEMAHK